MQVRDVMTTNVISVNPTASVLEIAKILFDNRISAVPVVDAEGRPVGIVSEGDLMHRPEAKTIRPRSWWLRSIFANPVTLAEDYARTYGLKARDVMTRHVITVSEEATLSDAAVQLERNRIKRMPVVRGGKIVGIISRANIVQAAAMLGKVASGTTNDDRAIRAALISQFRDQPWVIAHDTNVIAQDGVVELWGRVGSEEARTAMRAAANRIPGVKAVEDHLIIMPFTFWE